MVATPAAEVYGEPIYDSLLIDPGVYGEEPLVDSGPSSTTVTLPLADASATVYAPVVQPAQLLTLPFVDASGATYALTASNATGAQDVTLPAADAGAATYAPTVPAPTAPVSLGFLDAANATYAPTLQPFKKITAPFINASASTFAPKPQFALALSFVDAANATYAPTYIRYATPVSLDFVDAGAALYALTVTKTTSDVVFGETPGTSGNEGGFEARYKGQAQAIHVLSFNAFVPFSVTPVMPWDND